MSEAVKNHDEALLPEQKKPYQTPELVSYGTVAELTNSNANNTGSDSLINPSRS